MNKKIFLILMLTTLMITPLARGDAQVTLSYGNVRLEDDKLYADIYINFMISIWDYENYNFTGGRAGYMLIINDTFELTWNMTVQLILDVTDYGMEWFFDNCHGHSHWNDWKKTNDTAAGIVLIEAMDFILQVNENKFYEVITVWQNDTSDEDALVINNYQISIDDININDDDDDDSSDKEETDAAIEYLATWGIAIIIGAAAVVLSALGLANNRKAKQPSTRRIVLR